jgi:hypothetical protein
MYDDLTKAAVQAGTDKFGIHDYTPNYHKLFAHLRHKPIRVLEIGVGGYADDDRGGQSLEVWRDYFPHAQIVGIDIQKKTMDLGPRVSILQGSQVDPDFLDDLVKTHGPFDIIVDDGSHRNEHIVESYRLLFPTLAPGGIYVAEDVQTSFHPRFGGSLEMTAPNSVGYFGQIAQGLSTHSDDPLIHNISAMERFHNMIAVHKKCDGVAHDVFASNLFAPFADTAPRVTAIGDMPTLPFATKAPQCAHASDPIPPSDLLIVTLTDTPSIAQIETWFDTVANNGVMVIRSDTPTAHFGTDSPLGPYIRHRFTMLDHVEILVHHPEAPIDALAAQIYSLERYADAVVLHKAPNTYPSNFAFDASNAQAAAAIARMGEVLKDSDHVGGLVLYASILARNVSTSASAPPIQRLTAIGATSREYYQMAGALARSEKRVEDALALFTAALQKFPYDPQFSVMLAAILANRRQPIEAEAILRGAYEKNPRARNVVAALSRALEAKSEITEAKMLIESTINLFPQYMRPARLDILRRLEQTLETESSPI